ncbi:MAG: hypothetical protein ACLUD7_04025 [Lachnospiraceae bacterium]
MNIDINEEKIKYINLQLIATTGFIIALVVSFTLSVDKRESLRNGNRLYNDKEAQKISLMQTILVFIVALLFLYITYNQYKISHKYHETDESDLLLQSKTAILSIIAALIGLYIVIKNYNKNNLNIAEIESI